MMSARLSIPKAAQSHRSKSDESRHNEVLDELMKIQEEETAMVLSCARAKAATEKAEAAAIAKRVEADVAMRVAAADARVVQVEEEAKRKELEMKKRILEDRLSSISRNSSNAGSKSSSRHSIRSLPRPLPLRESVEKWMQTKGMADDVSQNNKLTTVVNNSICGGEEQEFFLPLQDVRSSVRPRDDVWKDPRDAKTVASLVIGEGRKTLRDVLCLPRDMSPAKLTQSHHNNHQEYTHADSKVDTKTAREKITARVLSALPMFSGDLEQWPAWIAEYRRSTEMNDYTELENLQRLQKSLTGRPKEMVSALLIYPENIPEIINLLERRFGRPEVIIKNLISSVRSRPPTKDYKPDTLVAFSDMVRNLVVTVKSLKQDHYLFNPQLMEELTEKLSTNMKLNWGMYVTSSQSQLKQPVGLDSFSLWLNLMADAVTVCAPSTYLPGGYKNTYRNDSVNKNFVLMQNDSEKKLGKKVCLCCTEQEHALAECKQFLGFDVQKRWDFVKSYRVCFNCLKVKHRAAQCRKKAACGVKGCNYFHHKLLHVEKKKGDVSNKQNQVSAELQTEHIGYQDQSMARVLLRVLSVTLIGKGERKIHTFALIDDGSTMSVMEKSLADELDLDGPTSPVSFSWTNGSIYTEDKSKTVSVTVLDGTGNPLILNNVKTLKELKLPTQSINLKQIKTKWPHLQSIPVEVLSRGRPRLLIGHEHVHFTVPTQVIIGPENSPIALKSKLGWTINGPTGGRYYKNRVDNDFIMFKSEVTKSMEELNTLVKKSFEQDFIDVPNNFCTRSDEEVNAESILEKTCTQTQDGRWQVGLLWREKNPELPESRSVAWKRLGYVHSKFNKNPTLKEQYYQQVTNYAEKSYAVKLNANQVKNKSGKTWYLPHFPVYNPNKPKKFRFVFDAASKSHGCSLNDYLLPGPNLFNSLISILFGFRKHKIAYAADIEEMFLRIKIRPEDQDALRFLWQGEDSTHQEEWCMTSMIFGAVCSPASAIYVTRKNAEKYGKGHEEAVLAIKEQFYMDDYLDSRETIEGAQNLIKDVMNICEKGGFNLRNFISNSTELMTSLPKTKCLKNYLKQDVELTDEDNTERVLGLYWNFRNDQFHFCSNFTKVKIEVVDLIEPPTKRQVLQALMSVYDPLGFITPITMKGKILLQNLWRLNVQWDEAIPTQLIKSWQNWMKEIKNSENLKIPRCYNLTSTHSLQLHVFCDASDKGFCAVAYFRMEVQGQVELSFVLAKSRVAPMQGSTIPRLELQAAVLGSRIASLVLQSHKIEVSKICFWTDSRIVWCWLQSDNKQKSTYIANRVKEILNTSEKKQWRWLPSGENIADGATRESVITLSDEYRWLLGPAFLRKQEESWPKIKSQPEECDSNEVILLTSSKDSLKPLIDMQRFSKYSRLIRTMAWVQRFISNAQRDEDKRNLNLSLSVEELQHAENMCFMLSQQESFSEEVKTLKTDKPLPRDSRLLKLSPILSESIIKMRGRTIYGKQISQEVKTPIILDPKQRLTILLIQNEHEKAAHQGQETVANNLRQRFWILRMKMAIKSCWANCIKCQLRRSIPKTPEMAPLPAYRLEPCGRPFTYVALDYFGPLEVTVGRRREKRYGALFTCLSVRAIHLELAASLNTDSAILAIRRFSARRGYPRELISDNGTNFRAAEKELKKALQTFDEGKLKMFCVEKSIKWSFLPPASPHMGGAHERLIQSVKKCLNVILNSQAPKEETLTTLLCEVEYIINNRPLSPVSEDPADELPLTPNHFLLGGADKLAPAIFIKENHLTKQWKIAQDYADKFWRRWLREYVPLLNKRAKWHTKQENLQEGDLVLIADENQPRGRWSKGIIQTIYPGRDGQVRVADVRTTTGIWRRPASKLVRLTK